MYICRNETLGESEVHSIFEGAAGIKHHFSVGK